MDKVEDRLIVLFNPSRALNVKSQPGKVQLRIVKIRRFVIAEAPVLRRG